MRSRVQLPPLAQEIHTAVRYFRWGLCGLLHDVDFEKYPEEHCKKAPELLAEIDASEEMVHAICSHAYGMTSDVEPVHQMEKVMFAAGCSRDTIKEGADRLGWTLDEILEKTILAMRSCEASVAQELTLLTE